jgi:pyridinium-3,5-bisthiocarboxylic acid mononucleotide nickel chelatase
MPQPMAASSTLLTAGSVSTDRVAAMDRLAWFQCLAGASGDMWLGALLDAGAPLETVQAAVDAVGVERIEITAEPVTRQGLAALQVEVRVERTPVVRTWGNIRTTIEDADLPDPVKARALDVFARLARAEARAHRIEPEQVHFHEVGALDAIADVVGSAAALHALGVTSAAATPVAVGQGMTRSEHGLLPVPGPAVVELLSEAGAPMYSGDVPYELCTPTGAALLAATVTRWGGLPPIRVTSSGSGAGRRDLDELPNLLRVVLGEPIPAADRTLPDAPLVLETNVDDLDPRLWPAILTRLIEAGASDAWLTPILMKKGRPAHTLSVLVPAAFAPAVRTTVFRETSSIGLREYEVRKHALDREDRIVDVDGQRICVKIAFLDGVVVNAQPEYDDVVAAAGRLGRPVKAVLAAATAAAQSAGLTS